MSAATVQITMTAADPGDPAKGRFITVALPRDVLAAAMAAAAARPIAHSKPGTLMPAFAKSDGGPLEDAQIANLATYLNFVIPYRPAINSMTPPIGSTNVPSVTR